MANKDNKVKYNIKNAHYALQKESDDGTITFDTPKPIQGSVSVSFDANGDIKPFYADGIQYYVSASNNGYEGDAEFALIPDSFRQDVLKEKKDEKMYCMRSAILPILLNLHFCLNLTETRKQSEECCTTVRQPDRRLNPAQKKKISNLAQRRSRSITHHFQMVA